MKILAIIAKNCADYNNNYNNFKYLESNEFKTDEDTTKIQKLLQIIKVKSAENGKYNSRSMQKWEFIPYTIDNKLII